LLPATLSHLAAQKVDQGIPWEVIIVDNGSTDGTRDVALRCWPADARAPLRVVSEPTLGLAFARTRGVADAAFDIITFADDDNWLSPHWVQTAYEVMRDHPEVGALGGIVEPQFETSRPGWFSPVAYLYATGPEGEPSGDVTGIHMLCGAGLNVRRRALADIRDKGFRAISVGRQGAGLGAGEDSEMTYSLLLAGWRLWIDPRLRLRHFLPARRLQWRYARALAYGSAYATPERDALVYACKPPRTGITLAIRRVRERWFCQLGTAGLGVLRVMRGVLKRTFDAASDGDRDVLAAEFALGRFSGLLAARRWYNARAAEIRNVMMTASTARARNG
jgi:glycosyltransferase involved in cell wall biosynthesis